MRFRPHVIHAHLHEGGVLGLLLKWLFRVPLVLDYQGSFTEELVDHGAFRRGTAVHRLLSFAEARLYRYVDAVLCNTYESAAALRSKLGVIKGRIEVIPDGGDTEFLKQSDSAEVDKLRRELNLDPSSKVVVYLGTLNRLEGIEVLLSAAKILALSREDVVFLVMGYPNAEKYEARAKRLGLDDRMKFTGRIPYQLAPTYLSLGDVAVSPKLSATEGNGKLFAYMGVGLPTVCFDLPVNREILGDLGVYAKPGDAESLAASLVQILDPAEDREGLGRRLRERLEREFSYAAIGQRLSHIYEEVTKRTAHDVV
jgi:glycosyltransferase involved in cell wall biosynthesis